MLRDGVKTSCARYSRSAGSAPQRTPVTCRADSVGAGLKNSSHRGRQAALWLVCGSFGRATGRMVLRVAYNGPCCTGRANSNAPKVPNVSLVEIARRLEDEDEVESNMNKLIILWRCVVVLERSQLGHMCLESGLQYSILRTRTDGQSYS